MRTPFQISMHIDARTRIADIELVGELDSTSAPRLNDLVVEAAAHPCAQLVLHMQRLTYMSSAGMRCLVFAHQKMGPDVEIVLVGTRLEVAETIEMTGFHRSVVMRDVAEA